MINGKTKINEYKISATLLKKANRDRLGRERCIKISKKKIYIEEI